MLTLPQFAVNEAELERMSDTDLAILEDRLLLEQEFELTRRSAFTAGKAVVWVLSALGVAVALALFSKLPTEKLGPLNIPLYLGAFGAGIVAGHGAWKVAGRQVRTGVRWLLTHWPVFLYLAALFYRK